MITTFLGGSPARPASGGMARCIARIFLATVPAFAAGLAIHEIAHLLAGRAVGFAVQSIRIGRIQFEPPRRISLYRGPGAGSGRWIGGSVFLIPVQTRDLAARAMAMIAAGPASNLACAAVVLLLPFAKGPFWGMFLLMSLVLGIMNLIPLHAQSVISDGGRLLMLLRRRGEGERWLAVMKLGAEIHEGRMPESFSPEFLALAVAVRDDSPETAIAHALAYASAFHRHADEEAAQALETALAYSGHAMPAVREALPCDAAIFQARRRKRADLAEDWLRLIPEKAQFPALRTRAEAAILEARGDLPGALAKLEESERALGGYANPLLRERALRLLRRWRTEVEQMQAAAIDRTAGDPQGAAPR